MERITRIGVGHFLQVVLLLVLWGCKNNDRTKNQAPDLHFADYKVWAEEGGSKVTFLAQFKKTAQAIPQKLGESSYVQLDDEQLKADSARYSGVYYEASRPLADFSGEHTITYFDGKKPYTEVFSFQPFVLPASWPATISRQNFRFPILGLTENRGDFLLSLTDTAFMSRDFNEMIEAVKGEVFLPVGMLAGLKNGPVHLQITREEVKGLKGKLKGTFTTSYSAQREFLLVD